MKILLVGGGGREHALAWKLVQSPLCEKLYCAPGNPGIAEVAECVPIDILEIEKLVAFSLSNNIDFVVAGGEPPLVAGLWDAMAAKGIPVFGPSKLAARLEGSKGFTKDLCAKYDMPTAAYARFTAVDPAKKFIAQTGAPIVIKADGLAAGKGVIIAQTLEEAYAAVEDMLSGNSFGKAGAEVVIEEFLDGEELSFFALSDGRSVVSFASAQDHKRVGDGDTGPNTGGMGAYSPAHLLTSSLHDAIMEEIILPTVEGMQEEGCPFQGVLYAGIMVVKGKPYLIEYNARFGDPECQVMMPRFKGDLVMLLHACATGNLETVPALEFVDDTALTVVMAAKGYPAAYAKGGVISGIDKAEQGDGVKVFHAGTSRNDKGELVSSGGRVLNVTVLGKDVSDAQQKSYKAVDQITWDDGFCRRDIGWRAVAAAKGKAA